MMLSHRSIAAEVYAGARALGLSSLQARIVAGRLPETAPLEAILHPTLGHIAPPNQLIDAERAIARLG
ncbi:MAG: DHH family phosphoesterase, partial [Litorivicinaceae bacterium]